MPSRRTTKLALFCAAVVAIASCSYGGDGDDEAATTATTDRTRETTEETVLGEVLERDVAVAPPAEPVPVPTTSPVTTTARPSTTVAPPAPTTTAPPTTTTTAAPRLNRLTGAYEARATANSVTVDLYKDGVLADARELGGSGTFAFVDLPAGTYRVLITDRQVEGDTSSEVITACPDVGLTDGDAASVDAAWDRDCTVLLSSG